MFNSYQFQLSPWFSAVWALKQVWVGMCGLHTVWSDEGVLSGCHGEVCSQPCRGDVIVDQSTQRMVKTIASTVYWKHILESLGNRLICKSRPGVPFEKVLHVLFNSFKLNQVLFFKSVHGDGAELRLANLASADMYKQVICKAMFSSLSHADTQNLGRAWHRRAICSEIRRYGCVQEDKSTHKHRYKWVDLYGTMADKLPAAIDWLPRGQKVLQLRERRKANLHKMGINTKK